MGCRRMTARAGDCLRGHREAAGVRRMTADARAGWGDGMAHRLRVTARAPPRGVVVLGVTGGALGVRAGGEHRTIAVTGRAGFDLSLAEGVWLVTAGAGRVSERAAAAPTCSG